MARLKIKDAPLLTNIIGDEKIPTGGKGDFTLTPSMLLSFVESRLPFATNAQLESVRQTLDTKIGTVKTELEASIDSLDIRVTNNETSVLGVVQDLTLHKADKSNPHAVTKQQVGLGNADNTSDINKPVSTATQNALNLKLDKQEAQDKIYKNGAALPYDSNITYNEGAVVVKDGELQQLVGGVWDVFKIPARAVGLGSTGKTVQDFYDASPINISMLDIDATGTTAVDQKLADVFTLAEQAGRKVISNGGTYLLNSNVVLKISTDCDLSNSVIKIGSSWDGQIELTRNSETVTYDPSSALVAKLKSNGILRKGNTRIESMIQDQTLDDHYVVIASSQPMYIYRGAQQYRIELDKWLKRGQIESGFFYDFDMNTITSVKAQKVNKNQIDVKLVIDESLLSVNKTIVAVRNGNNLKIDVNFIDNSIHNKSITINRVGIYTDVHNVELSCQVPSTYIDTGSQSSYTVFAGQNYDLRFNRIFSDGYGWGSFGMNTCKNVSFKDCQVSRIDFHNPCYNWLKIDNCTIGNWGVLVTMIGDLFIRNCKFLQRYGYANSGIIRTRTDTGGFCNGDLHWENNTIEGVSSLSLIPFLVCQGNHTETADSPVRAEIFTNVYIDGLYTKGATAFLSRLFSIPATFTDTTNKLPKNIIVKNAIIESQAIQPLNINFGFFAKRSEGVVLEYHNCKCELLNLSDTLQVGTDVSVLLNNFTGVGFNRGVAITNTANASIRTVNSDTRSYADVTGGIASPYSTQVRFNGGRLLNTTNAIYIDSQNTTKDRIRFSNIDFTYGSSPELILDLAHFTPVSCTFNNKSYIYVYEGVAKSNHVFTCPSSATSIKLLLRANNQESVEHIYVSSNNTVTLQNGSVVVAVSSGVATLTITATNITVVGVTS